MSQKTATLQLLNDPIKHIRTHRQMYLRGDDVDPRHLALQVAGGALLLGATNAGCTQAGGWWIAWADVDWLGRDGRDLRQPFAHILPFREAGANAMRWEVVLTAFSTDILTWRGVADRIETIETIKIEGDQAVTIGAAIDALKAVRPAWIGFPTYRVIAFRIDAAQEQSAKLAG